MVVRRVLTRLLRLRQLEEELQRLELEGAVVERTHAERTMQTALERRAEGRGSFVAGIESADRLQRAEGLMVLSHAEWEMHQAIPFLLATENEVERQKEQFLMHRTARQQVETLVAEARQTEEMETARRAQQMLDDWYGRRIRDRKSLGSQSPEAAPDYSRPNE